MASRVLPEFHQLELPRVLDSSPKIRFFIYETHRLECISVDDRPLRNYKVPEVAVRYGCDRDPRYTHSYVKIRPMRPYDRVTNNDTGNGASPTMIHSLCLNTILFLLAFDNKSACAAVARPGGPQPLLAEPVKPWILPRSYRRIEPRTPRCSHPRSSAKSAPSVSMECDRLRTGSPK